MGQSNDHIDLCQNPLWGDYLDALMEQQLAETALMLCAARLHAGGWPVAAIGDAARLHAGGWPVAAIGDAAQLSRERIWHPMCSASVSAVRGSFGDLSSRTPAVDTGL
jgi:hypothetical protein